MTEIEYNIKEPIAATTSSVATTSTSLLARELSSAINSPELLEEHKKINGNKVRTR